MSRPKIKVEGDIVTIEVDDFEDEWGEICRELLKEPIVQKTIKKVLAKREKEEKEGVVR